MTQCGCKVIKNVVSLFIKSAENRMTCISGERHLHHGERGAVSREMHDAGAPGQNAFDSVDKSLNCYLHRGFLYLIYYKLTVFYHRKIEWTCLDVKITLDVGGSDKLAEDVWARRRVQLRGEDPDVKDEANRAPLPASPSGEDRKAAHLDRLAELGQSGFEGLHGDGVRAGDVAVALVHSGGDAVHLAVVQHWGNRTREETVDSSPWKCCSSSLSWRLFVWTFCVFTGTKMSKCGWRTGSSVEWRAAGFLLLLLLLLLPWSLRGNHAQN